MTPKTKDRLAWSAAKLFQEKGYHGVGLSEILTATGLPKGSLYHHFPNGKADLALAAAEFASRELIRIIDDAYTDAHDWQDGTTTLFYKLAKLFEYMGKWTGCPVSSILITGPDDESLRTHCNEIFDRWINHLTAIALRLGLPPDQAQPRSEQVFMTLQGAWTLARARRDADILRAVPGMLFPEG